MSITPRSRRFVLVAAVVIGLSACGSAASTGSESQGTVAAARPPVIHVAGGGASTPSAQSASDAAISSASPESSKMSFAAYFDYVYGGDPVDLTAPAASWYFASGATPTDEQIMQLAAAFGVDGDIRTLPADQGGGWAVGSEDYSQPSVNVGADATLGWWYNAGYDETSVDSCVMVDPAVDVPASVSETVAPPETSVSSSPEAVPTTVATPCPEPTPPVDVPSASEAEANAVELMTALGLDPANYELETYADEWSSSVTAFFVLDGMRTPMSMSVGYGEGGSVTWAGGFLATPQRGADYPRIGVDAAVQRLNDQSTGWSGYAGASGTARGEAEVTSEAAVEPAIAPTETYDATDLTVLIDPVPPEDSFVQPDAEPVTVTLINPRPSLEMLWDEDNTVWLLPGYAFDSTDNGTFSVIAVEDQYLDIDPVVSDPAVQEPATTVPLDPPPTYVTVAPDPANPPPTTAVDASDCAAPAAPATTAAAGETAAPDATSLIGLCQADAEFFAQTTLGVSMRVVRIDGEDLPVTMDYIDTRVNVAVDKGIVTEIVSFG